MTMATSSAVGIPNGDGWKARYVHWDGYPNGVGMAVYTIAARDGLDLAIRVLTQDHAYWSTLTAEETSASPDRKGFEFVAGYGVTSANRGADDVWLTQAVEDCGAGWVYVLSDAGLFVIKGDMGNWRRPVIVPWGLRLTEAYEVLSDIENRIA